MIKASPCLQAEGVKSPNQFFGRGAKQAKEKAFD
jgi:hypothetical protein